MNQPPDRQLDIVAGDVDHAHEGDRADLGGEGRWLGIQFECCNVYTRIYKNNARTAYVGWCPHCSRAVRVPIGPGGTSSRFFRAR